MSNSAYFGVTDLPDGVSIDSELGYGYRLDPLKVAAVPEPGTGSLVGLGFLALSRGRRRRPQGHAPRARLQPAR